VQVDPAGTVAAHQESLGPVAAAQQCPDGPDHFRIVDQQCSAHPALGWVVELDGLLLQRHVLAKHRGDSIRVVLLGVLLAARPEVAEVEQVDGEREDPVALEAAAAEVGGDAPPHVGQRGRHLQHPVELLLVALLLPLLVVEVLAAARGVGSDRLDVPVRVGADPHFLPRGRDDQVLDTLQRFRIRDWRAVRILVGDPAPAAHPANSGAADGATAKSHV
jgi:hypothetical protein